MISDGFARCYHGGEAQQARDDYLALSPDDRRVLPRFLGRQRAPRAPNEELLAL